MALKNTFNRKNNFGTTSILSDCYCKVVAVSGDKNMIFADLSAMSQDQTYTYFTQRFSFKPDLDGGNFILQAYQHIKTLPEFAGAKDC